MVGASKILTVSYGTFSCTLEGFDDSFDTMKAIAEYFRDLSSEDRYFGAEPPTPDAEMLARIAEKEVNRRVEARITDNNVVLRPSEPAALEQKTPAPAAFSPDAQPDASPLRKATPAPAAKPMAAKPLSAGLAAGDAAVDADSIAAKLQRIRAVVAQNKAGASERLFAEDEQVGELAEEFVQDAEIANPTPVDDPELAEAAAADDADLAYDDEEYDALSALENIEQAPQEANSDVDAQGEEEAADDAIYDEDSVAEYEDDEAQAEDDTDAILNALLDQPEIETAETDSDEALAIEVEAEAEAEDDVIAEDEDAMLARLSGSFDTTGAEEEDTSEAEATESTVAFDEDEDDAALFTSFEDEEERDAEIAASDDVEDEAVSLDAEIDTAEDSIEVAALAEETALEEDVFDAQEDDTAEEDEAPTLAMAAAARARARVIKMKTADVEDAIAAGTLTPLELEEEEDAPEVEPAETAAHLLEDDSTLSREEEEDLAAELAHVEAEERGPVRPARVKPRRAVIASEGHDEAVERLLEETNSKLEESEGARRRSGFAHLKAAVAATVADRKFLGGKSQPKEDTEPYREDLAAAVKPSKPTSGGSPRREQAPAPLMLVSEQRVDTPSPKRGQMTAVEVDTTAVSGNLALQPTEEVALETYTLAGAERILSDSTSFEDFAKELGASELPDLLEAAAAYVAYVEGRPQFSRPHLMGIMSKAQQAEGFSREEELQSFGQLLREGRLQKVQRGQFTVASSCKYRPEQRYGHE